jgi:hypothetical protein
MIAPSLSFRSEDMSNQQEQECRKTISVPEAGSQYFGFSKNHSYIAAARGDFPVIRIGGRIRVPVEALEAMLKVEVPPAA